MRRIGRIGRITIAKSNKNEKITVRITNCDEKIILLLSSNVYHYIVYSSSK